MIISIRTLDKNGTKFEISFEGKLKPGINFSSGQGSMIVHISDVFSIPDVEYYMSKVISWVRTLLCPYFNETSLKVEHIDSDGNVLESVKYNDGKAVRCVYKNTVSCKDDSGRYWYKENIDGDKGISALFRALEREKAGVDLDSAARNQLNMYNGSDYNAVTLEGLDADSQDLTVLLCTIYRYWFVNDFNFARKDIINNVSDMINIMYILHYLDIYKNNFWFGIGPYGDVRSVDLGSFFGKLVPLPSLNLADNNKENYIDGNDYIEHYIECDNSVEVINRIGAIIRQAASKNNMTYSQVLRCVAIGCFGIKEKKMSISELVSKGCRGIPAEHLEFTASMIQQIEACVPKKGQVYARESDKK